MYSVQKIKSLTELREYAGELEEFEKRLTVKSLFVSYRWVETWIRAYLKQYHFSIFIIRQNHQIVAFLPLVDMNPHKIHLSPRRLELISISSQGDLVYLPCTANPRHVAQVLLEYLKWDGKYWDYIYLESLYETDELAQNLITIADQYGYKYNYGALIEQQMNWYVQTDRDWQAYYDSLSSRIRNQIKRKTKKCNKIGGISVNLVTSLKSNDDIWEELLEIDRNTWQFENGIGVSSSKNHGFYLNLARQFSDSGLQIWILKIGDKPAAFELSIAFRNKVYGLRWGYHKEFQNFSPGQLLRYESLKYCFENGFSEFDLLGKHDTAKKLWATSSRHEKELLILNNTFWGKYMQFKYKPPIQKCINYLKSFQRDES